MASRGCGRRPKLGWLLLVMALWGCAETDASFEIGGFRYPLEGLTQWALPKDLREISGLALDRDGRLFAHADEVAVVTELDYRSGRTLKRFALGDPPRPGDYEGIAWVGRTLYLVTSDGELLEAEEGDDDAHVDYRLFATGFGRRCEIEGLEYDTRRESLMMLCKTPHQAALRGRVALLAWSPSRRAAAPEHDVLAVWPPASAEGPALHPSALTVSTGNGNFVIAAARQRALLEVDGAGEVIRVFSMPRDRGHPQMEGIAMTPDGDLILADEGRGKRGRLSVYAAER